MTIKTENKYRLVSHYEPTFTIDLKVEENENLFDLAFKKLDVALAKTAKGWMLFNLSEQRPDDAYITTFPLEWERGKVQQDSLEYLGWNLLISTESYNQLTEEEFHQKSEEI